jgi:WD40 repeat protein
MKKFLLIVMAFSLRMLAQNKPELVITNGHLSAIQAMDFHPSGRFIATSSDDHSVKVWDLALKQEFRTLYGHAASVDEVKYSYDGKFLVSMDHMGYVVIWNAMTGERLHKIKTININKVFSLSRNSNSMLVYTPDSITMYDLASGKKLSQAEMDKDENFALLSNNKEYIAIANNMKDLAVYSINGGDPIKELKSGISSFFNSRLYYNDKENLCALFSMNEIVVFDLSKWSVKHKIPFAPADRIKALQFTSDGKKLAAACENNKIMIYDLSTGKESLVINEFGKTPDYTKDFATCLGVNDVAWSPDGKMIVTSGMLTEMKQKKFTSKQASFIYNAVNGKRLGSLEGSFKFINNLGLVNSDKYMVTMVINQSSPGMRFWNLRDGSIMKNIPGYSCSFSKNTDKACVWYPPDSLTVFNSKDFSIEKQLKVKNVQASLLSDDGNYLVATIVYTATPAKMGIQIYDTRTYSLVAKYDVEQRNFSLNTYISPDSKYLIGVARNKLDVKNLLTGKNIPQKDVSYSISKLLAFVPGTSQAVVADVEFEANEPSKIHIIDYVKGEETESFGTGTQNWMNSASFSSDGKYIALGSGTSFGDDFMIQVVDWQSKSVRCSLLGHHNSVDYLKWNTEGTLLFSASQDGTAKEWDIAQCTERGTFICMAGPEEYIIHSPDYYYKCSKGNYDGICFRYKGKLYRFDQFDIVLNRPDIVMERLNSPKLLVGMYRQAWKKRIKRLGFTEEMLSGTLSLPEAEVGGKESIAQAGGKVKFTLKARDEGANINRVNVYVNNVPLYGVKGMDVSGDKSKTLSKEISIDLSNGTNLIEVMVTNDKGLESPKESFEIDYQNPAAAKPGLYIFAVGVSRFKEPKHNLVFPVKDANDFINIMKSDAQFAKVEVSMLKDSMVTKENVIASSKMLEKAGINDQVIIYISSHGLLDSKLDYFIAMNDVNFDEPSERGLPYEEIENMLNKVPSRNRLVLIDACHSGEVDKEGVEIVSTNKNPDASMVSAKAGNFEVKPKAGLKNSFAYMQALFSDVSKGSGATVISAAGGNEFALESKDWNNGVFT